MNFVELCDAILKELPEDKREELGPEINSIKHTALFRAPELMVESWAALAYLLDDKTDLAADYTSKIMLLWLEAAKETREQKERAAE